MDGYFVARYYAKHASLLVDVLATIPSWIEVSLAAYISIACFALRAALQILGKLRIFGTEQVLCNSLHANPCVPDSVIVSQLQAVGLHCMGAVTHNTELARAVQFVVLVFLKTRTPPLLLVLLNYMRLFRLLRLMRFLKVCPGFSRHSRPTAFLYHITQ